MNWLVEPFGYQYMLNAMWVSAMVGGLCAFLSCYLMLKRCAISLYCAWRRWRLDVRAALLARRVSFRRTGGRQYALS